MAQRRLEVIIAGDEKGAKKAIDSTEQSAGSLGDKLKSALGNAPGLIAGAAVGAVAGIGIALKGAYDAAAESAKITRETERVIRTTGGAANVTASEVGNLAGAISDATGADDELVQSTANLLLTFTNVKNEVGEGNDIFNQATGLALDMATALGTDASGAAIQLGKALNDPVKGITALSRAGVSFTEQQKEQIKAMVQAGDLLGAQKIILAELSKEFGGAAEAAGTPLDKLMVKIGNFQEAVGARLIPIVDAAADWLGSTLPAAFEVAEERLDGLIGLVAPLASGAFDKLASAVEGASNFLSEHVEVVKLLATAGLIDLAAKLAETAGAFTKLASGQAISAISGQLRNLTAYLAYAKAAFLEVAASQGVLTASGQALGYVLSSAAAKIALVTGAIYLFTRGSDEGTAAADRFLSKLDLSTTNLPAMEASLHSLEDRIRSTNDTLRNASFGDKLAAMADAIIPFHDVQNSLHDLKSENDKLNDSFNAGDDAVKRANQTYSDLATKLVATGLASDDMVGSSTELVDRLKSIASQEKIDPLQPGAPEKLQELYEAAVNADPAAQQLKGAMDQMGNAAADADDKVKAFKEALDALFGVEMATWDSSTKVAKAVNDLADAHVRGKGMFDLSTSATAANNDEILKNRDALSNVIQAYQGDTFAVYQSAMAHGTEQQAVQAASATLGQHREELIRVMGQLGLTRGQAEAYINQLGFTPDSVNTIINLFDQGSPGRVSDYHNRLNGIPGSVGTSVYLDVSAAEANLRRYNIELNDLERRVIASNVNYGGRFADGGIVVHSFAGGGTESHVAQIARGGAWRLWAEPETGGEAYIPLGATKRRRSTEILGRVADMFGYQMLPAGMTRGGGASSTTVVNETHIHVNAGAVVADEESLGRVVNRGLAAAQRQGARMAWSEG